MEIVSPMSPPPAAFFVTVTASRTPGSIICAVVIASVECKDFECHLLIQSFITGFSIGGVLFGPIFLPKLAVYSKL